MRKFVWCTYRNWSFQILEGLGPIPDWELGLIVTTKDCRYDFSSFEKNGTLVLRIDPKVDLKNDGVGLKAIKDVAPSAIFHYGWSWIVPPELLTICPNVTLHPGKLPKDRGGSPLQNQIRNGETWTYSNLIELVGDLDGGGVYDRVKISLEGDLMDDVWLRMVSAGQIISRQFLKNISAGSAKAEPQDPSVVPSIYRRVSAKDAVLKPREQTALFMYNVIRSHNETDPNSYVRPATINVGMQHLSITRATLIDNPEALLSIRGTDGRILYVTRFTLQ